MAIQISNFVYVLPNTHGRVRSALLFMLQYVSTFGAIISVPYSYEYSRMCMRPWMELAGCPGLAPGGQVAGWSQVEVVVQVQLVAQSHRDRAPPRADEATLEPSIGFSDQNLRCSVYVQPDSTAPSLGPANRHAQLPRMLQNQPLLNCGWPWHG